MAFYVEDVKEIQCTYVFCFLLHRKKTKKEASSASFELRVRLQKHFKKRLQMNALSNGLNFLHDAVTYENTFCWRNFTKT